MTIPLIRALRDDEPLMHAQSLFDLAGKHAIVTGGSRGLGLEIATALAEAGASVAITARRKSWLDEADARLRAEGFDSMGMCCDVTQPNDVANLTTSVLSRWSNVDILVNNAGISWAAPAARMPLEKWQSTIDTNVTGTFLMSQAVGRHMIETGRGGAIINIASVVGIVGTSPELLDAVGYSASKGAVIALTRDLSAKWGRHRIRVNAIAPGFFPTRLTAGMIDERRRLIEAATPLGRAGEPGELKGAALFLASNASSYVTGQVLAVDGGHSAW